VLVPRARWLLPDASPPPPDLLAAVMALGLRPWSAGLLQRRGIATADELARHLGEPRDGLHDPTLLPDSDRFAERIRRARDTGETVLVFGDFDADGITGLAVLTLALQAFGVTTRTYVPSRLEEGHGLSLAAVDAALAAGASVIVTVDTGTTSVAEVATARERGIDVLVTDHHRVPAVLPAAAAIVNAHRPDSRYPDNRLSGAGIAFTLARLLLGEVPVALGLAELAAIGTIADVAPILGENRAIVRLGLERIRSAPRPGTAALLARAGIDRSSVDVESLSFAIAPRLNAAGRVGEAMDAARLLLAEEPAEAESLAGILEAANLERRDLTKQALAEARTAPATLEDRAATVVRGPWPVGVIGLVAGRLAEELGRPAIVGAELGDLIRASCRGDGSLHLADALTACQGLLLRHGGHAGAAGFELAAADWDTFRERFIALAAGASVPTTDAVLGIDVALPAADVDYRLHAELARLGPWGVGNPEPLVAVEGLTVVRAREASGGHTQLVLKRRLDVLDGIAFGWPELSTMVSAGDRLDVVGRVASRRFGGVESLQIEIHDAAPSGRLSVAVGAAAGGGSALADRERAAGPRGLARSGA
jgi:single-stranded-DNA-specific exonuclease